METLIKAPYLTVGFQNKSLFLGFGSIQKEISQPKLQPTLIKILNEFTSANTWIQVRTKLQKEPHFDECEAIIKTGNYLIPEHLYKPEERFSRATLFYSLLGINPVMAQRKLTQAKVGIIGCGGIGNLVSVNLATAGVSKFILCDNDDVEASNLSRQIMFTEEDVGTLKCDQLAKALRDRANYVEAQSINKKILTPEDLEEFKVCDLLVVSADKGNVVNIVNEFSAQSKIPFINVGYVNDIAVWGPFVIPGETGCYACQDIVAGDSLSNELNELNEMLRNINQGYQAPSVGPVNMLSSSLASLDIMNFLVGSKNIQSLNKRLGLWTHNLKLEEQDCSKSSKCKVCS